MKRTKAAAGDTSDGEVLPVPPVPEDGNEAERPCTSKKRKKKKKKKSKDHEHSDPAEVTPNKVLEVDFQLLKAGVKADSDAAKSGTFAAVVQVTKDFPDLSSFSRHLRVQHVEPRAKKKGMEHFDLALAVKKRTNDSLKILSVESPSEWTSLYMQLLLCPEMYSLQVTARGVSVASHAAAMLLVERKKRMRQRARSTEAEADAAYETKLRAFIDKKCEEPSRTERQSSMFQEFTKRVETRYPGCTAINDLQIKCGNCGTIWKLNRRWYETHFGDNHFEKRDKCKPKTGARQLTMLEMIAKQSHRDDDADSGEDVSEIEGSDTDPELGDLEEDLVFLDPVAEMLHEQVMHGHLQRDHIFYQYVKKCLKFVGHCQHGTIHNFKWNTEDGALLSFLETVLHLGHERTYNLLRGPGFIDQGKGGTFKFDWGTWNFPLPSVETLRNSKVAYTTESGLIAPLMQCLMETAIDSETSPVIDNPCVKVIPVVRAMDGMALKPGMQVDERTKELIGTTMQLDIDFVKTHDQIDPTFFKDKFVKEAEVTCVSTLDGTVAMPIGVDYVAGKADGENVFSSMKTRCEQLQTCMICLESNTGPVVASDLCETDTCEQCCSSRSVCERCSSDGHQHWSPALRQCNRCRTAGVQCHRFACFANTSDCEEKNKQALMKLKEASEEETIAPSLAQIVPIPDAVHLGKNLNGSFSNWYLRYEGSRFNKSVLRTLWKEPSQIGNKLKELITLKSLRYRDRMDSHFVTDISNPKVRRVLQEVTMVSHTLVPEMYRNYESNKVGVLMHPTQVCCGPDGTIFVVDASKGTTVKARLHYPVDVETVVKNLQTPQGIFYAGGVLFVSNTEANCIVYVDVTQQTKLKVNSMKRGDLLAECIIRGLAGEGSHETVQVLRHHLNTWLKQQLDPVPENRTVNIDPPIEEPGAIGGDTSSFDHIFVVSLADRKVYRVDITCNGAVLSGVATVLIDLGRDALPRGLHWDRSQGVLYIADSSPQGGIIAHSPESGDMNNILRNGSPSCQQVYDITCAGGHLMYTDQSAHRLGMVKEQGAGTYVCGISTEQPKSVDGSQHCAAFAQPLGVCAEGNSIFLCDAAAGRLKLVTDLTGMIAYLQALYDLYRAFAIHVDTNPTLPMSISIIGDVLDFLRKGEDDIRSQTRMARQLQGPDGAVASKTVESVALLRTSLMSLEREMESFGCKEEINVKSLLTLVCERFFSDMRSRFEMPLQLQFATLFGANLRECLKRMTRCGFHYFTSRHSYYPVPTGLHFHYIPQLPVPTPVKLDQNSIQRLHDFQREHGQSVRQQSVRSFSTKDRPGTLPISAYLQKEPEIASLELSTNQPPTEVTILPVGTAATVLDLPLCLILTLEAVKSSTIQVNVNLFKQSTTNCLQFVRPEHASVLVKDLVVVDLDHVAVSPRTLEVSDEAYHIILQHRNHVIHNEHVEHDQAGDPAQEVGLIVRSRRSRKISKPARFQD